MSRLIDADRLLTERMKSKYYRLPNGDLAIPLIDIEHAPTIDAIEVVRCKECKHRPRYEGKGCFDTVCPFADGGFRRVPDDDFFCKKGERR